MKIDDKWLACQRDLNTLFIIRLYYLLYVVDICEELKKLAKNLICITCGLHKNRGN